MASKPTFVLVPGMWHRPAFFNKLKDHLSQRGLSSVAIDMPSSATGTNAAIVSREPDIEAIASVIRRILVRGDDVVVLMHSFGGISGSEAVGRILEEEASLRGRGGKIRRLVYVTAFLASEDEMVPVIQGVVDDYAPDFFDVHVRLLHSLPTVSRQALTRDIPLHRTVASSPATKEPKNGSTATTSPAQNRRSISVPWAPTPSPRSSRKSGTRPGNRFPRHMSTPASTGLFRSP